MNKIEPKSYEIKNYEYNSVKGRWENWATSHLHRQKINPFSENWKPEDTDLPPKTHHLYGRPKPGSKTEFRGKMADIHISKEVIELCEAIQNIGTPLKDGTVGVTFGRLFQYYSKVSHNVVGLLIRARRRGIVKFNGEMLYQRQDEDEIIYLVGSIDQLVEEIEEQKKKLSKHESIGKRF